MGKTLYIKYIAFWIEKFLSKIENASILKLKWRVTKSIKAFLNLSPETCAEPILFDGPEGGININPAFCNI